MSLSEQKFLFDQSLKGLRVCIFSISLLPPRPNPTNKNHVMNTLSLARVLFSALWFGVNLSVPWLSRSNRTAVKTMQKLGRAVISGGAGESGAHQACVPHQHTVCRTWVSHGWAQPHGRPVPSWGSPLLVPLLFSGTFTSERVFVHYIIPCTSLGPLHKHKYLLGGPLASFHPESQQILSKQIQRSVLTAGVVHSTSSPLWPQFSCQKSPGSSLCIWSPRCGYLSEVTDPPFNSSPCYCVHYSAECAQNM